MDDVDSDQNILKTVPAKQFPISFCVVYCRVQERLSKQHQTPAQSLNDWTQLNQTLKKRLTLWLRLCALSVEVRVSSSKANVFYKHFDNPEILQHVVLSYTICDQNGEPVTAEGRLLQKVVTFAKR
eukprot:IDg14055t1